MHRSRISKDRKSIDVNRRSVISICRDNELDRRRQDISRYKQPQDKPTRNEVSSHEIIIFIGYCSYSILTCTQPENVTREQNELIEKEKKRTLQRDGARYRMKLIDRYRVR
jgi:hypothetical protein